MLVIPDFIANAGGVIAAAVEYRGGTESQAFDAIEERIRRNTQEVLRHAKEQQITPRAAGEEIARGRVVRAMGFRRRV